LFALILHYGPSINHFVYFHMTYLTEVYKCIRRNKSKIINSNAKNLK